MRSFIKSHRRGSSGALSENMSDLSMNSLQPASSSVLDDYKPVTSRHSSPSMASQVSPGRSNKLQRLFQRGKGGASSSSANLMTLGMPPSPSWKSTSSPPPTIKGTRTHEWGVGANTKNRPLTSEQSSSGSLYSSSSSNHNSSSVSNEMSNDVLQLPLNTVLEIPDTTSPTKITNNSQSRLKNIHRRAQIVTADSPMSPPGATDDTKHNLPMMDMTYFDVIPDAPEAETIEVAGLAPAPMITGSRERSPDDTIDGIQMSSPDEPEEEAVLSDNESEFSFEQSGIGGRNTSIRYYKNPQDVESERPVVREKGFYIDDYMEEEFDEDMNYFDEYDDDLINDDEELFNRKYFSDDEDDAPNKKDTSTPTIVPSVSQKKLFTPQDTAPAPPPQLTSSTPLLTPTNPTSLPPDTDLLKPKRSLKYHQLPGTIEQEFEERRYSWLSEDGADTSHHQSYDSLLDEINNIPDDYDYDYDYETPKNTHRSKSLKSALKRLPLMAETPQNTKYQTGDKSVTLFHRSSTSRQSSVRSERAKSPEGEEMQYHSFGYMTPNSSFTSPNPGFTQNQRDVELSPISEGSYIDDSHYLEESP